MQISQASVLIVGNWNPRIFTPSWIRTQLLDLDSKTQIGGLINFEDFSFGFQYKEITFLPRFNSLEVRINTMERKELEFASKIVIKIFDLLPHTPIKAMGVNFQYGFSANEKIGLLKSLNGIDLNFHEFIIDQVRHTLQKNSYKINIISDIAKKVVTTFNFHYDSIKNLDPNFINKHLDEAKQILKYGN
jgi:hypothetical protein